MTAGLAKSRVFYCADDIIRMCGSVQVRKSAPSVRGETA